MKRAFALALLATIIISACVPVSAPPSTPATAMALLPTDTPIPTATSIITPTPVATSQPTATTRIAVKVAETTFLFPFPDSTMGQGSPLTAGTMVYLIAKYGDFVQIETTLSNGNQVGFVPIVALDTVFPTIALLDENSVPWSNRTNDLEAHLTINPDTSYNATDNVIVVDNSEHDYYNDYVIYLLKPFSGFRLTFQLQTSDGQYGSIKLADKPNNPDDPKIKWWSDIRRVDFATNEGFLQIVLRDGRTEDSATTIPLGIPKTKTITVNFLDAQGKVFSITDASGRKIRQIDVTKVSGVHFPNGLFPEKEIYIGRVVSPGSKLSIRSLSLESVPDGKFVKVEPTLRQLAKEAGISLGTEFGWWRMQDPRYYKIIFDNYDTLILSEFSSKEFWRGRGVYDFESLDRIVDWAIRQGFRVRASHLVWGATESDVLPDWLLQGNFSRDEYIQILKEHVMTVASHFKGRVTEWSIANEAISRSAWKGSDFWMDKIGPKYIELSFLWAREADPNGILIFNDNNNESPRDQETRRIINGMYDTVKRLKSNGVPIDVVGMQMHLLLKFSSQIPPKKQDVLDTIRKFGELGVKVYVTEFDVDVHRVPGNQQERWTYQANLYQDMLEACLESGVCTSLATWGVSDSTSWITCEYKWCVQVPDADPLMFDKDFNPKPAYFVVRDVLLRYAKTPYNTPPNTASSRWTLLGRSSCG